MNLPTSTWPFAKEDCHRGEYGEHYSPRSQCVLEPCHAVNVHSVSWECVAPAHRLPQPGLHPRRGWGTPAEASLAGGRSL